MRHAWVAIAVMVVASPLRAQEATEAPALPMCASQGGPLLPCDDLWDDGGEANRHARLLRAADWADSVAVLGKDSYGYAVKSCRACAAVDVDSATVAYAAALRRRYPVRPLDLWNLPVLDASEVDAGATEAPTLPELPVQITIRQSVLGKGLVAQFKNLTRAPLTASARFSSPATDERRVYPLAIPTYGVAEFGHVEGWTFAPGHVIELSAPGFRPLRFVVP